MRCLLFASLLLVAAGSNQALAQDCSNGPILSAEEINELLSNRWVCARSGNDTWNVQISGGLSGTVTDYKRGPRDPVDPSAEIGRYSITGDRRGQITYDYGAGGSYTYQIRAEGRRGRTQPGSFAFCGVNGGRSFQVTVDRSPRSCAPN